MRQTKHKTYLTEIHDNALMNLLPQVSPEDLNEGDLQCGDLAVHKDSCQVKLYLETHIHLKTEEKNCKMQAKTDIFNSHFKINLSGKRNMYKCLFY